MTLTTEVRSDADGGPDARAAATSGRRRPLAWMLAGLVTAFVLVVVALPQLVWLRVAAPEFSDGDAVSLPGYGADGTYVLVYEHGEEMTLRARIANRSLLPVTVTDVRLTDEALPLVNPTAVRADGGTLPVTLWPGESVELALQARFDHCRFYHEREVQVMDELRVDAHVAGRRFTRGVGLDQRMLVHAPMLVGCPDRTLDRGDDVRR